MLGNKPVSGLIMDDVLIIKNISGRGIAQSCIMVGVRILPKVSSSPLELTCNNYEKGD